MKNYTFVDYATQGYLLVVAMLVLFFHSDRTPLGFYLVGAHAIVMGLIHGLIRFHASRPSRGFLDFLRFFYPILLFTFFYRETGALHHMFFPHFLDSLMIRWEQALFGMQPSLAFMDHLPYLAVSELLYAAYFTYYFMIVGIGIALFIRNRRHFFHYISVLSFVFYACYLTYIVVPVMGPRAFYSAPMGDELTVDIPPDQIPPYPEAVQKGPFFQVMKFIYHYMEAPGAAFPSSHVAIAIVTVCFSFRYLPRIRYFHLVDVILLCISTVYCRYHYVVDVAAGIATAAILVPVANWLYFRCSDLKTPGDETDASLVSEEVKTTPGSARI